MFDIRLRLASDSGAKGRVLKTQTLSWTGTESATPVLTFSLSQAVAGKLEAPFLVMVEYTTGGSFVRPRNDLFIAFEDNSDGIDRTKTASFTAHGYVPWLMTKNLLNWARSARNGERRFVQFPHSTGGSATPGHVLHAMLTEAKGRGWGPGLAWDFTASKDSAGADWSLAGGNLWWTPWQLLTPASRVLDQMSSQGFCEWWAEGTTLRLVRPGTGADKSQSVTLGGKGFASAPGRSSFQDVFTHLTVVPEKARNWLYLTNDGADTRFGRLESSMTQSGVEDHTVARGLAQATLNAGRALKREQSYDWTPSAGMPVPFADFNIGDTVTVQPRGGGRKLERVVGIIVTKEQGAAPTVRTVTGDKLLSQQAKIAKRTGAATAGGIIGGTGNGLSPSTTLSPSPEAPASLRVAASEGFFSPDGTARSAVTLAWAPVTSADDGSELDVAGYEVWARTPDGLASLLTQTEAETVVIDAWEPDRLRLVKVRARSVGGVWSAFSEEVSVLPAAPASEVPATPGGLTLASNVGTFAADGSASATVRVTWPAVQQATDGTLIEVPAYRAELEDGQAWVELVETPGREVTFAVPSGKTRRVRVRARTALGVWSDPSEALEVTGAPPAQVTTAPSAPLLTTGRGLVAVSWDGELAGDIDPPSSFHQLYAETAPATTGPWTRAAGAPASTRGGVATVQGTIGADVFVRLFWVDTLGRTSAPSAVRSVKVASVMATDIEQTIRDAIEKASRDAGEALGEVGKAVRTSLDEYVVTDSATVPPPAGAAWSSDTPDWTPGQYVWRRTRNTHIDDSVTFSAPAVITGADGAAGEDAVLLRVSSSRGTSFKNNAIATVLSVTVFRGARQISNITELHAEFGSGAFIEWWWRRIDDSDFGVISSADSRLSQAGFALTVSPADVDDQTVFQAILHT
ncbi:hypothetical protein [Microbacterium arborescens]|uniref:hypothetical protein n=1 Tax=Microbacterium arborescens TaxID=33883 RepID=UPI000DF782DF|nr:hypothetical protein [Microbacterium arborescens]